MDFLTTDQPPDTSNKGSKPGVSAMSFMDHLVSTEWLATHVTDPDVVVLDASLPMVGVTPADDVYATHLAKHIPGAVFFNIEALSESATTLPHMLPTPEAFAANMGALGISDTAHIVVYEQQGVFSAPRAWWMLRTLGAARVSVLDGGLRSWVASGGMTEAGLVIRPTARFEAALDAVAVKDLAGIKDLLAQHGQVVDARSAARFNGTAPEPRPGIPSGHMPGAINLPFGELVRDGRLLPAEELRAAFAACGLDFSRPITTTCGSGITAAVLTLALEIAGAADISLYDGSWADYASQPGTAIVAEAGC